jgi:hypothetical protein
MKRFCILLLLVIVTSAQANPPARASSQADIDAAKAAVKAFAGALQTELQTAMQSGGPVAAIEVCNARALPISQLVSAEKGMDLSRVSLRNRNPLNAPNDWQTSVLEQFEAQKLAGKDVQSIAWTETVATDGGHEFRFMKAIPTAGVCLACHGASLSPEISAKLTDLYPEDKATGFFEGDIRGAFVVTRRVSE